MEKWRFAIHVGPTAVNTVAEALTKLGLEAVLAGTERVHFSASGETTDAVRGRVLHMLLVFNGSTFGIRHYDIIALRHTK